MGKHLIIKAKISRATTKKWLRWSAAVFLLSGIITTTSAQNAIPATGGNASGQGGSVSFSVGQVIYTSINVEGNLVIQGVQQPYVVSVVSSSLETPLIGFEVEAYPNPVTDFLTLKVELENSQQFQSYFYELFNTNGSLVEKKEITGSHTNIQMGHLTSASYLLIVSYSRDSLPFGQAIPLQTKTFKIIKR